MRALLILVALVTRAHAQCDPYSQSQPLEIPAQLRLDHTCGNGHVDTYATSCVRFASGGCGQPNRSGDRCEKVKEVCDGRDMGGNTCKSLGFTGGQLRCGYQCGGYDTKRCTLCPPHSSCSEENGSEYADLRLMLQGDHVRIYYTQEVKSLRVADVDLTTGALTNRRVVSNQSAVATQVGSSALTIDGTREHPELVLVKADGTIERQPIAKSGEIFPAYDQPLGVVYGDDNVSVLDETGTVRPPAALVARGGYMNQSLVFLQPLSSGTHQFRWQSFQAEVNTQPGDALVVRSGQGFTIGIVHDGVVTALKPKTTTTGPGIAIDGVVVFTVNETEVVALGVHHSLAPPPKPAKPLLGDLVYRYPNGFSTVRTATTEVQAAVIWEQLAVAVRKL